MRWGIFIFALLGMLMSTSIASASRQAPQQGKPLKIAIKYWGHPCPKRGIKVKWTYFPAHHRMALGWANGSECEIHLNRRQGKMLWNPRIRCSVMLHEVGHLSGRAHNSNPRSVMYYRQVMIPKVCRGL